MQKLLYIIYVIIIKLYTLVTNNKNDSWIRAYFIE